MLDGAQWLKRLREVGSARARLVCFPHAGAHPIAFRAWPAGLPDDVSVVSAQLPGRGARLDERPMTDLDRVAHHIADALIPVLDRPVVFFGHSMGAMLAFAVTHRLRELGAPLPQHLVVSARRGPRVADREPALSSLSDSGFIREMVARYGGIPAELLQHADVMALLLPALRADIAALESYTPPTARLPVPISAFGGTSDRLLTRDDLAAWSAETDAGFRMRLFPGGHFYQDEHRAAVLAELSSLFDRVASRTLEVQY
jgi:medium-chain acyl-[acyl-carrier-protein] hydrolase